VSKEKRSLIALIGKGTLSLSFANSILKLITLATVFIILNRLSAYDYGVVELAQAAVGLFSIFLLPGITSTIVADIAILRTQGDIAGAKGTLLSFFKTHLMLCVLAWAVVFFGADVIATFYTHHITDLIKILSFMFLIAPFRSLLAIIFRVYLSFNVQAINSVTEALMRLLVLCVGFFVFGLGYYAVVLAAVVSEYVTFFLFAYIGYRIAADMHVVKATRMAYFATLYAHGKWSVFASYFNTLGQNVRLWIIQYILGAEFVGYFSVAYGMLQHTMDFLPIGSVLAPVIPKYVSDRGKLLPILRKAIKYHLLAFIGLALIAFFIFTPILSLLFPQYALSLTMYNIMLVAFIPLSFAAIFTPTFFALRAQKNLFWSIGVKNLSILLLAPLAAMYVGLVGVAFEFILTNTLFSLERYRVLKKMVPGFSLSPRAFVTYDDADRLIVGTVMRSIFPKR
jgi:O-antigen/teichoic acid export membrane protein